MLKTFCSAFLAGIALVAPALPAGASRTTYTTIVGKKTGDQKGRPTPAPTPPPGPIAKENPGTHKEAPTPAPSRMPIKIIPANTTIKR